MLCSGRVQCLVRLAMITAISADGTDVRAFDDGQGPVILVIHPGLDDGRSWTKVARRLARRFRVVRIVRRHYRADIPAASGYSMAREVEDVLALAEVPAATTAPTSKRLARWRASSRP